MSLIKDLARSEKIESRSRFALERMPEDTDENEVTLTVLFQASAMDIASKQGLQINSRIGSIFTARASLKGLKELVDNKTVYRIECGRLMPPGQSAPEQDWFN